MLFLASSVEALARAATRDAVRSVTSVGTMSCEVERVLRMSLALSSGLMLVLAMVNMK